MELFNLSLVLTVILLLYLTSFVFFALLRIVTGLSIQRVGWSGLRHLSFPVKEGLRIDIGGLGLSVHRPTFVQPTWASIVIREARVTLDPKFYGQKAKARGRWDWWKYLFYGKNGHNNNLNSGDNEQFGTDRSRGQTWKHLTDLKDKVKRLHRQIRWLRMLDLVSLDASFVIVDVGRVEVAHFTLAVDTRKRTSRRNWLFQYIRPRSNRQHPLEWYVTLRSVLFAPYEKESTEVLDHSLLNIQGLLHEDIEGLRDATVSLKMGKLKIPLDDVQESTGRYRMIYQSHQHVRHGNIEQNGSIASKKIANEATMQDISAITQSVSESKALIDSILRGIREFQFTTGFLGLTKCVLPSSGDLPAVFLNFSMKEIGADLTRLDPHSPAHRMYFPSSDIAHQGLIAAISISVGIDNGRDQPERLLYVPMATATTRTTLPAKAMEISDGKNVEERNANLLFANLVITSPSVDLDPKHLPMLLKMLHYRRNPPTTAHPETFSNQLMRQILPKSSIKFSVQEPVVRVTLPVADEKLSETEDFDLIISAMSSISIDVESSHSAEGELHYSIQSNLRIISHQLYYQTALRERHNLLETDSLELKTQMNASPNVSVSLTGEFRSFSVYLIRPEISKGLHKILVNIWDFSTREYPRLATTNKESFLRRMPQWLEYVQLSGLNFNVEVAGIDSSVSTQAQGCALHLESWSTEYKTNYVGGKESLDTAHRKSVTEQRRGSNNLKSSLPSSTSFESLHYGSSTDGRRLAVHIHGFEGYAIGIPQVSRPDMFILLPRFEVAFKTSTDAQGQVFHINSVAHAILAHYSISRHYSIGMAVMVLKKTFSKSTVKMDQRAKAYPSPAPPEDDIAHAFGQDREMIAFDFKTPFIQLKATMPADPPLMLEMYSFDTGKHRWASPFARASMLRLYTQPPSVKNIWSRLISIKAVRLDYRHSRTQRGHQFIKERSIDIASDAVRLGVPHQLIAHNIFSNIINVAKTTKQLHHRFQTGSDEYILGKKPEAPKQVPKVSVRCNAFVFEIEDGAFEWKLGVIYRLGLLEQKQRLARDKAFEIKSRKIQEMEQRKASNRTKARSAREGTQKKREGLNSDARADQGAKQKQKSPFSTIRYETVGTCALSENARLSIDKARERLQLLNARSWKKRVDHGFRTQNNAINDLRSTFWGEDDIFDSVEQREKFITLPARPSLMVFLASNVHFVVNKPSFPLEDCPKFLHEIGKGMPLDTEYSLLVPMNVQLSLSEARIILRDYPLPLIHIPSMAPGQSLRSSSFLLKSDFVIAEEYRNNESILPVDVVVVPPSTSSDGTGKGLSVKVGRSVSPVKTFSNMAIEVNTSASTKITWGTSYQPAIQDMMQVIEGFNKAPIDPSERVGFWDKIRLSFHSKINVHWKGDGDVHLILKGSRDPYMITGLGTGFVMCWQNNVKWSMHQHKDPKKFMTVDSGNYILAIPDLTRYAKNTEGDGAERSFNEIIDSRKKAPSFRKVIMKLSGNVQWLVGLVFERNTDDRNRSFQFKPHYDVTLKNPEFAKACNSQGYDAFKGFRSNHIHMSIAVSAPVDRDWTVTNLKPSSNYNSVHLTPRFFSHFFSWWSLFNGQMALPVRQGPLWQGIEKSGKKFGRHIATIKYNLLLSPVYISHVYKHKDAEDYGSGIVSATGLKMKMNSLMLDLHQRREEFNIDAEGKKRTTRASRLRINEAQLDFISADVRAVSVSIAGTDPGDMEKMTDETLDAYRREFASVDVSRFSISDKDYSWIDVDDFVELDWILPAEASPETKIIPLAYTPRFTYFRQTDHANSINCKTSISSPFGHEPTHYCVISAANDPRRVQRDIIQQNVDRIEEQLSRARKSVIEEQTKLARKTNGQSENDSHLEVLQKHCSDLVGKQQFLRSISKRLGAHLDDNVDESEGYRDENRSGNETDSKVQPSVEAMGAEPLSDYMNDFSNRFVVHNPQIKWNNSLRDIILRYIHQNSQRRGFVYYMSQRAVKFIQDILEDQRKSRSSAQYQYEYNSEEQDASPTSGEDEMNVEQRINQLLDDTRKVVNANDPKSVEGTHKSSDANKSGEDISDDFTALNSYHVRLIAPQIQLQSEKDTRSALVVSATALKLKVIQIMDKDRIFDEVSGLVQRRFSATMDNLQVFMTSTKTFSGKDLQLYLGNHYGTPKGSIWPPWVPFEAMFEFNISPCGFHRIVGRTSAGLRMDKYNPLRLKFNDNVKSNGGAANLNSETNDSGIDQLRFEFPQIKAVCNSDQYYAMYIIALDLMLYSEPLEKSRSERLEKIILASDFSDLTGAPELVRMLQDRIRDLEEIKTHMQINERNLDRDGWKSRIALDRELAVCEDELFFIMKAITTAQRQAVDRHQNGQSIGLLRWHITASEIGWHLLREGGKSLAEFQLQKAVYDRVDNNDGSNQSLVEIDRMHGLNCLPDAIYPDMIAPYLDKNSSIMDSRGTKMLRVRWLMLQAIAGIPIVDHFEVNLFPLKLQLEREIGKRLFEYIFPGSNSATSENGHFSPFALKSRFAPASDQEPYAGKADKEDPFIPVQSHSPSESASESMTGIGALELRLQPTLQPSVKDKGGLLKSKHSPHASHGEHYFRRFQHQHKPKSDQQHGLPQSSRVSSNGDLVALTSQGTHGLHGMKPDLSLYMDMDKHKRPSLQRINSPTKDGKQSKEMVSDDLTQMLTRASNYMTLAYVKVPSVVLCLSYKGRGQRNLEDINELVFRMPTLEYRNKTWSNLDLALQLKKDVIKALISHAGALVGNKFTHNRLMMKNHHHSRLRDAAAASTLTPTSIDSSADVSAATSEANSVADQRFGEDFEESPQDSFLTGRSSSSSIAISTASHEDALGIRATATEPATVDMAKSSRPVPAITRSLSFMSRNGGDGSLKNGASPSSAAADKSPGRMREKLSGLGQTLTRSPGGNGDGDSLASAKRKGMKLLPKRMLNHHGGNGRSNGNAH